MTARRRGRGTTARRKLGERVQAKTGGGKGGCRGERRGCRGRKKGRGRGAGGERAGAAGSFPLVRAGCRETRGPMSAHQLSPAPAACPYMVRPLGGRSRTSPYKGRNLNTGYTLFSARPAAAPAIDERAAERAAARGLRARAGEGRGGRAAGPDVVGVMAARASCGAGKESPAAAARLPPSFLPPPPSLLLPALFPRCKCK